MGLETKSYELVLTGVGAFAPLGEGEEPPELESPTFGPGVGYPEPESVATFDFGLLERGSFIVLTSSVGDLRDVSASIDGDPVSVEVDARGRVGIMISFVLDSEQHRLEVFDPSGDILIARADFELEDIVLGPEDGFGFVPLANEEYESIEAAPLLLSGSGLPSSVDLSGWLPPAGDQGRQNACVGFVIGYALKTYQEARERGWDTRDASHQFSPSFIFNRIHQGCDVGSTMRDALQLLQTTGCITIDLEPIPETVLTLDR